MNGSEIQIDFPTDYPPERKETARNAFRNRANEIIEMMKTKITTEYPGYVIFDTTKPFKDSSVYYVLFYQGGQIKLQKTKYLNSGANGQGFYKMDKNNVNTTKVVPITNSPVWEKSLGSSVFGGNSLEESNLYNSSGIAVSNNVFSRRDGKGDEFLSARYTVVPDLLVEEQTGKMIYKEPESSTSPSTRIGGKSRRHRKNSLRKRKSKKSKKRRHTKRR